MARRWEIRSATAGRVLRVFHESETVLAAGAPVIEVADPRSLEIVVDVLSVEAVQIEPGAAARIERWGRSEALAARVRQIEPAAFMKVSALGVEEQRVNVVLDLLSPPQRWPTLGDGYRVEAEIVVFAVADALSVPISALVRQGEHWAVFVVREGRALVRQIVLGPRNPSAALVRQGLEAGETVVLYPGDQIRDGVRVTSR
jgi:HlyD family secretion protein